MVCLFEDIYVQGYDPGGIVVIVAAVKTLPGVIFRCTRISLPVFLNSIE